MNIVKTTPQRGGKIAGRVTHRQGLCIAVLFALSAVPLAAQQAYHAKVLGLNPTLYYRLNETPSLGVATNLGSAGSAADATYQSGAAAGAPGAISGDTAITCSGGAVKVPAGIVASGSNTFSVSFWVKPTSFSGGDFGTPFGYGGNNPVHNCVLISEDGLGGAGRLRIGRYAGDFIISRGQLKVGEWNHVGLTYDGATAWLYLNGVLDSSGDVLLTAQNDLVLLGALFQDGSQVYEGDLDEFAYWAGSVLSFPEMESLSHDGDPTVPKFVQHPQGKVQMTGEDGTLAVAALGAQPLVYQWLKNGAPILNATNTILGITNAQSNDEGSFQVVVTNEYGSITSAVASLIVVTNITYPDYLRSLSPTLYYRFNESLDLGVATNLGLAGTAGDAMYQAGASASAPGVLPGDNAITCNGGAVQVPAGIAAFDNNPFSVCFWVKPTSFAPGDFGTPFGYGGDNPMFNCMLISEDGLGGAGKLRIGRYAEDFIISRRPLTAGEWNHVAVTYDGSCARLYINGTLDTSSEAVSLTAQNESVVLGALFQDGSQKYDGGLDEFAYWTGIRLSGAEISNLASPSRLTLQRVGETGVLTWISGGVLQVADDVTGAYVDVPNARSPHAIAFNSEEKYYRLKP